jgi:hypothetical protein
MPITVNFLNATPACLSPGANTATIDYEGMVDTAADNNVAINATSNNPDVTVVSVTPTTQDFPLTVKTLPPLKLQLHVNNPGGCGLQVTISITFKTAQGAIAPMDVVFLY